MAGAEETPDLVQERISCNAATAITQPYGVIFNHAASRTGTDGPTGPEGPACAPSPRKGASRPT
ncbi:hypothetical protein [Breoghania sp.]|uniref:hypothetical protein n=1 Tax=Breoghania sp. TaxID=2065378 RepID=UPI0026208735|nr:hypothetical protein [Breoghania sp.]MDJ0930212.1 hypothetical protein [Breoghania sp.]